MRSVATPSSFHRRALVALAALAVLALGVAPAAHATITHYSCALSGAAEFPANASPGTGTALVDVDDVANTMHVHIDFTGLLGTTTASHIHCATAVAFTGTAGVATTTPYFAGFPIGVTAGTYDNVLDMTMASSYNPSFVTAHGTIAAAEAFLFASLAAGTAYVNIHTTVVPGGEIRGFPVPTNATPTQTSTWGRIKQLYR